MQVKQIIEYKSDNRYFGGFLQNIIDESGVEASVSQKKGSVELIFGKNDENRLNLFYELVDKYLPYSIFMGDVSSVATDEFPSSKKFISEDYNIAPCIKCLEMLNDPSSQYYLDASLKCDHYSNESSETFEDNTIFSPHYSKGCSVLVTDAQKINDLFIMTEDEIKTLFSIEKPTLKVTIKDEILKELCSKNYINIKAPYNNRSALTAINAKESGVDYLFFEDMDDLKMVVVQKNKTIIKASRVAKELEALHEDKEINRFLNISKEAGFEKGSIGVDLNTRGINFIVSNEVGVQKVIKFQEFKLSDFFFGIHNDGIKLKLIDNFYKKFPHIEDKLSGTMEVDLFELICILLDIEKGDCPFDTLCDKSFEFRGNGGLKIDMHYSSEGFDYVSFLGSIMSFRLAGAETHYIAYSVFEAFADMAISTLNQLGDRFKNKNYVMMGDMFANSVLYSRILSKFQLSNPYFSETIALSQ